MQSSLFTTFLHALGWNAFSYGTYKICYLLASYALYAKLSQADFTLWATLTSLVYFWLLILDCGFRKSVPRFCPEFSSTQALHRSFVQWICAIQIIILICALPVWYQLLPACFERLHIPFDRSTHLLGTCLFFLQGCLALMRLMYHAHFWNKQFNSLATGIVCIECLVTLLLCPFIHESAVLMHLVLMTNCIGALCTTVISCYMMLRILMPQSALFQNIHTTSSTLSRQFIVHSLFMWGANTLKSLTERNFLIPYILYSLGPTIGISCKLTHDAALFFYRIALKTVGVNDTSFLAYARHCPEETTVALTQLIKTVIYLGIVLGIAAFVLVYGAYYLFSYQVLIVPFSIFLVSYMIEFLLSPYERLLEVSLRYKLLTIAYVPYCIALLSLFSYNTITWLGLVPFIAIVQLSRIVSACIMVYAARRLA